MSEQLRVLHIEFGRHFYGGANQLYHLSSRIAALYGEHIVLVDQRGDLTDEYFHPPIEFYQIGCAGDLDFRVIFKILKVIWYTKPSAVHVHSRRGDMLAAIAAKIARVPCILSRRVDNPPSRFDVLFKFPLFTKIIAISNAIKQVLEVGGVAPEKISVIHDGVDTILYRPNVKSAKVKRAFDLPDNAVIVMMVAQFIKRKGHQVLLDAMQEVLSVVPETHLMFFGQGPLEEKIAKLVAKRELDDRVVFCGFYPDIAEILPQADLLVHPALMEGLGVALLEAAACGLPIVASDVGGIPEVVQDGVNGLLVEPGNSQQLAEAILKVLLDKASAAEFGSASREIILREFSVEELVNKHIAFYQEFFP